jgi:hypothetical protein
LGAFHAKVSILSPASPAQGIATRANSVQKCARVKTKAAGTPLFRGVHSAIHAAVAALSWWVLQHWQQLQDQIADYKTYALPAVLAALALLFRMSDTLAKAILERIPVFSRLLRRMLSGHQSVEGDWPLVVINMEEQKLLYLGFLSIDYRGGQLYVCGDDWHPNGTLAHGFHSVQSRYDSHMLQYWYEQGMSMHHPDMRGYTEIYFFPKDSLAERHAGKFLDPVHTSDIRFYARKHRYRTFQRRFGHGDKDKKLEAANRLWAELEPRLPDLSRLKISADFA